MILKKIQNKKNECQNEYKYKVDYFNGCIEVYYNNDPDSIFKIKRTNKMVYMMNSMDDLELMNYIRGFLSGIDLSDFTNDFKKSAFRVYIVGLIESLYQKLYNENKEKEEDDKQLKFDFY